METDEQIFVKKLYTSGNLSQLLYRDVYIVSSVQQRGHTVLTAPCDEVDVAGRKNKCSICRLKREIGSEWRHVEHLEAALTRCAAMLTAQLQPGTCSLHVHVSMF